MKFLSTATDRVICPVYKHARAYDVPSVVLDISKAKHEMGWTPEIGLSERIFKTRQRMEAL